MEQVVGQKRKRVDLDDGADRKDNDRKDKDKDGDSYVDNQEVNDNDDGETDEEEDEDDEEEDEDDKEEQRQLLKEKQQRQAELERRKQLVEKEEEINLKQEEVETDMDLKQAVLFAKNYYFDPNTKGASEIETDDDDDIYDEKVPRRLTFNEIRDILLHGVLPRFKNPRWVHERYDKFLQFVVDIASHSHVIKYGGSGYYICNKGKTVKSNSILLECLFRSGFDIETYRAEERTLLQLAIRYNYQDMVEALLNLPPTYNLNFDHVSPLSKKCAAQSICLLSTIESTEIAKLFDQILARTSNVRISSVCSWEYSLKCGTTLTDIWYSSYVHVVLNRIPNDYDPEGYGQFEFNSAIVQQLATVKDFAEQVTSIQKRIRNYQIEFIHALKNWISVSELCALIGTFCFVNV